MTSKPALTGPSEQQRIAHPGAYNLDYLERLITGGAMTDVWKPELLALVRAVRAAMDYMQADESPAGDVAHTWFELTESLAPFRQEVGE